MSKLRPVRAETMRSTGSLNQFQSHRIASTTSATATTATTVRHGCAWTAARALRRGWTGGVDSLGMRRLRWVRRPDSRDGGQTAVNVMAAVQAGSVTWAITEM